MACAGSLLVDFRACERRTSEGEPGETGSGEEGLENAVQTLRCGVLG